MAQLSRMPSIGHRGPQASRLCCVLAAGSKRLRSGAAAREGRASHPRAIREACAVAGRASSADQPRRQFYLVADTFARLRRDAAAPSAAAPRPRRRLACRRRPLSPAPPAAAMALSLATRAVRAPQPRCRRHPGAAARVAPRPCRPLAAASGPGNADQPRASSAPALRAIAEPLEGMAAAAADDEASQPSRRAAPTLALRIDGEWYDCSTWAREHPGGAMFVAMFNGRDASDLFYAFHSYGPNGAPKFAAVSWVSCCDPEKR